MYAENLSQDRQDMRLFLLLPLCLPFAVLISCVQDEKQEQPHGGKLIFRLKLKLISAEWRTVWYSEDVDAFAFLKYIRPKNRNEMK